MSFILPKFQTMYFHTKVDPGWIEMPNYTGCPEKNGTLWVEKIAF